MRSSFMQHNDFPETLDTPFNNMTAFLLRQHVNEDDYQFLRSIARHDRHSDLSQYEKGRFYGLLDHFDYFDGGELPVVTMDDLMESIKRMLEGPDSAWEGE